MVCKIKLHKVTQNGLVNDINHVTNMVARETTLTYFRVLVTYQINIK